MSTVEATVGTECREGAVKEKCTDDGGHWRCLTHDEDFPHNFAMQSHTANSEAHIVSWVCHTHGPEVP